MTRLYTLGNSPIRVSEVKKALKKYPCQEKAYALINGLQYGFDMKYSGPRRPFEANGKEIFGERLLAARQKIQKEISMGRIAGPFINPPFPTFRTSPISVIPKKSSSEFRLIHNLSFPSQNSVNDFIEREFCSVSYSSIDDAVDMIQKLGPNSFLAKCDIKSAFRLLRISPQDFDLFGFKFENLYYFDKCLPMGASISCALFESFSTALHWYVKKESNSENILHYLDDFLFGGVSVPECKEVLICFQDCCKLWGVPLADEKTVEPTEILIFLGVEFDTINMIMRLPLEKITELREKILYCLGCSKITLKELQSLLGSLNFACQVVVPGRAFCRRLIDATCNVQKSYYRIRVTKAMKDDLEVWLQFLSEYNGTTVILDKFWSSNSDLNLFSDSAGGKEKGFGIFFDNRWAQACWPSSWVNSDILTDITFLELFPVVVALNIWGELLRNKRILFHVDNQAVVAIVNKKSSRSPRVMSLVRKLVLDCLKYNILIKCEHIPGVMNKVCDALSRCDFQKFQTLCPTAEPRPCAIPSHLWKI